VERPETVVVYARSEPDNGLEAVSGIHEQQSACSAAATRLGAHVVASFVDVGYGGHTLDRPGLKHLMGWLDYPGQELPDYVAVVTPDRLAERERDLMRVYAELGRRGIRILIAETDAVVEVHVPDPSATPRMRAQPDRERVGDAEIDLTGSVDQTESLIDVIRDAVMEAGHGGVVPDWGARAIARLLANAQDGGPSALHHFAATGQILPIPLVDELAACMDSPTLTGFERDIIACLGLYLKDLSRRERLAIESSYSDATKALIMERGPAYAAFLTLPDVTEETAPELFFEAHVGSFESVEHLVDRVVDDLELDEYRGTDPSGGLTIDAARVVDLAMERWDIVSYGDHLYAFEK